MRLKKVSAVAASTLEELQTQTRAGLQHAISERRLLDLDVFLSSPLVVVPEDGVRREGGNGSVLVADFGSLQITSDIQHFVPDVMVRMPLSIRTVNAVSLVYQGATLEELEKAFYDRFKLSLSHMSVILTGMSLK